jgi:RecA-family ATPase
MAPRVADSLTLKELAMGEYAPPVPLVEGLLVEGGGAVWSALWGTGKTWLALELARCVAAGGDFLGRFPTRPGKVLYLDQEGTPGGHKERLVKLENGHPFGWDLDVRFVYVSGLILTEYEGFLFLDKLLATEKPALVVLDSWVRFFRGNENDAVAVAAFNDSLRSLRLAHGCATLPLDHTRKRPPNGATDHPEDRTRASGEKLAGVDNGLTIEKAKDRPGTLLAYPIKARWSADLPPFRIAFASDPTVNEVTLRWDGEASTDEVAKELGKPIMVARAVAALKGQFGEDAATVATVTRYLEWSEWTTRQAIGGMVGSGQLTSHEGTSSGGRKATCYDLTEGAE